MYTGAGGEPEGDLAFAVDTGAQGLLTVEYLQSYTELWQGWVLVRLGVGRTVCARGGEKRGRAPRYGTTLTGFWTHPFSLLTVSPPVSVPANVSGLTVVFQPLKNATCRKLRWENATGDFKFKVTGLSTY